MRLTLRTLLAYLDNILDEPDAEELKSKIDESEVATQLVQRIGQVGQTRLDAPPIEAEGIGADANSVAEYLDNTLAADDVPDFEQACLEADMHLGEVAACHQILTLVLGEPAEIAPRLRQSIHQLGSTDPIDGEASTTDLDRTPIPSVTREPEANPKAPLDQPAPGGLGATIQPVPQRDADEHWTKAPDYLKKRRRSVWKPVGIAALILICLVIAGLSGTGPLNLNHPLAQLVLGRPAPEQPEENGELTVPESTIPPVPEEAMNPQDTAPLDAPLDTAPLDRPAVDRPMVDAPPFEDTAIEGDPINDGTIEPDPTEAPYSDVVEDAPGDDVALPDTFNPPDVPTDESTPTIDATAETNLPETIPTEPSTAGPILPPDPPVLEQPASVQPDPDQPEGIVPVFTDANANPSDDVAADPVEPADLADGPKELGRFLSEDQVLARFNPTDETWQSVPPRAPFIENDLLMVFPIFRPQLMLASGMQVTFVGPGRAQLLAPSVDDQPNVRLEYGRATIVTFAQSGTAIGITWPAGSATVSLADTSSTFAIAVDRHHAPGADPETEQPHTVVRVVATSGDIEWQMAGAEPIPMTADQQLLIVDEDLPQIVDGVEIPEWIEGRDARPIDPLAVRRLQPFLTEDRPVSLSLQEQADSRRLEVRSLAVCSLAYLGELDPLLVALNDDRLKSYWSTQFQALQHAASLDNETATKVRQAIEARHGVEGQPLFRMLQGFSPAQLNEGAAQMLVDFLDHESSDFRVAAIENLRAITGVPSLYMPHYSEKLRRKHVVAWRNKLNKGQIKYREAPPFSAPADVPIEP